MQQLRDPEVRELGMELPVRKIRGRQEDIGGLDIAVHDVPRVHVVQAFCEVGADVRHLLLRKTLCQDLAQIRAVDEFHDDERALSGRGLLCTGVEQGHEGVVVEGRERVDLVALAAQLLRVGRTGCHELDGDLAREFFVGRAVHSRHPAAPDQGGDAVATPEQAADGRIRRNCG